jgi:ferritin
MKKMLMALVAVVAVTQARTGLAAENDSRLAKDLEAKLNQQVNAELFSSYLYLSMAAYFDSINLEGFAHWMRVQTAEENEHGLMFFDYINERNGRVLLTKIEGPKTDWKSPLDAFEEAYEHEKHISELIDNLVNHAREIQDNATDEFLQWFVEEQVEEEVSTYRIVQQLKLIGDDRAGLYLLDRELAKRDAAE